MAHRVGRFYHGETHYDCLKSLDAGAFTVTERRFPKSYFEPPHYHSAPYVMQVVDGGLSEGGVDYAAGDLGYQPAGKHTSQVRDNGSHLIVLESPTSLGSEPSTSRDPVLRFAFAQIVWELRVSDPFSVLAIEGLAMTFWQRTGNGGFSTECVGPKWLGSVAERLANDTPSSWSLTSLANDANVHPATLSRGFFRHFGCSPAEFARNARLEKAKMLLSGHELDIGEVAIKTGFADQSHLGRWFRRKYGVSPAQFRSTQFREC